MDLAVISNFIRRITPLIFALPLCGLISLLFLDVVKDHIEPEYRKTVKELKQIIFVSIWIFSLFAIVRFFYIMAEIYLSAS